MNAVSRGIGTLVVRSMTGAPTGAVSGVDPGRFGIELEEPACCHRAGGILSAFFSGFECGLKSPSQMEAEAARTPRLFWPFFHEGFAMGSLPNGYLRFLSAKTTLERFELTHGEADPFVFLRYVGIGFWLGFQHARTPARVDAFASRLAARKFAPLLHDGFGFKTGFFGHGRLSRGDLSPLHVLRGFSGFAFESALNGLGRSLWFFTMDRPQRGFDLVRRLGRDARSILGGMGLAAAFTFPDQLSRAYNALESLPSGEKPHFLKGIRIALHVRHRCDASLLSAELDRQPADLRARAAKDLEGALQVEALTGHKEDFIEKFHAGCLAV